MKIGKTKKISSISLPAEKPQKVALNRKPVALPIPATVAKARLAARRSEPAPQPSAKTAKRLKELKRSARAKTVNLAGKEPTPQPRMVVGRKRVLIRPKKQEPTAVRDEAAPVVKKPQQTVVESKGAGMTVVKAASTRRSPKQSPLIRETNAEPANVELPRSQRSVAPVVVATGPQTALVTRPSVGAPPETKPRHVRQPRPVPVEIPAILLEPDHVPNEPAIAGPGARFALTPPMTHAGGGAPDELPESYGTGQIFLAARDPYCLFASWDLDATQRARYNAASASGALTIRLRRGFAEGPIELEVHTAPNSRDRFIEVAQPDTSFVAELGFHEKRSGAWQRISFSKPTRTPRDRMAPTAPPPFAPAEKAPVAPPAKPAPRVETESVFPAPAAQILEMQSRHQEVIFAIQPGDERGHRWEAKQQPGPDPEPPRWAPAPEQPRWKPAPPVKWKPKTVKPPKWSAVKARALEELISLEFRRMQQGSLELEEVLRRRILRPGEEVEELPSSLDLVEDWEAEELTGEALELGQVAPSSLELAEGRAEARKGFWFKVNAELIIYGSTEPDAHVSIGGRPIRLRADGSFSYRFALPDGAYELPVVAVAHDGHDARSAELQFSRATHYTREVGAHAQDAALKSPSPANL